LPLIFSRLTRGFEWRFGDSECAPIFSERTEKAGAKSLMTGRADLFDLNQQSVTVAVERDVFDGLRVATGLAFHPQLLAGATPEMGSARFNGFLKRSAIHPGHHEHALGFKILNDGGNQALRAKFQLIVKTHLRQRVLAARSGANQEFPSRT